MLNQLRDEDSSPQKGIFLTADRETTYKFHKYMIKQTKIFVKQITKSFSFLIKLHFEHPLTIQLLLNLYKIVLSNRRITFSQT